MNSQKYSRGFLKVTSWVAIIIIASIAATLGFFIWTSAHESWLYEDQSTRFTIVRRGISSVVTTLETVTWKTYRDEQFKFQVRHPAKYQENIGKVVSSPFGVSGTTVGPLVLVKADDTGLKTRLENSFNSFWNNKSCVKKAINKDLDIKIALCTFSDGEANYALVKGDTSDIFVDGRVFRTNAELASLYTDKNPMSQDEFLTILSSFKFTK